MEGVISSRLPLLRDLVNIRRSNRIEKSDLVKTGTLHLEMWEILKEALNEIVEANDRVFLLCI